VRKIGRKWFRIMERMSEKDRERLDGKREVENL
jgi:hypothetical protein